MHEYINYLLDKSIAFMGSDWVKDDSVTEGMMKGFRHVGEKPCINCNDWFFWGCADSEDITDELVPDFKKAIEECMGNEEMGAMLYCGRQRKMRPQGAAYYYVPKELWALFDACGPEREAGVGNPYNPGEYNPCGEGS